MRVGNNIYVNRINPHMGVNEFFKATSAESAQTSVNEYINFDISNSVTDLLEVEEQKRFKLNEKKETFIERLKFLEEKKTELENTLRIVGENEAIKNAIKVLEEEMHDQEVGLQNTYNEMGEDGYVNKKLLDMGYVLGTVAKTDGIFTEGMPVYAVLSRLDPAFQKVRGNL